MGLNHTSTLNISAVEEALYLFQTVAYTPVFVVGLLLNTSALWLFFRLRSWTDTHIYMFNLLLADLLLVLFVPFRIYDGIYHMTPGPICTFLISVHYTNMYVSMFTIAAISVHRTVVLSFPLLTKAPDTKKKMIACSVCVLVWVTVITISTRFLPSLNPKKLLRCYQRDIKTSSLSNLMVLVIVGYLLPMVTVTTCSTVLMRLLLKSAEGIDEGNAAGRRKAVDVIKANMIVFIFCFTPLHFSYLLRYLSMSTWINFNIVFSKVSAWIAATNCCLDSVGYYFLLKKVFKVKDSSQNDCNMEKFCIQKKAKELTMSWSLWHGNQLS